MAMLRDEDSTLVLLLTSTSIFFTDVLSAATVAADDDDGEVSVLLWWRILVIMKPRASTAPRDDSIVYSDQHRDKIVLSCLDIPVQCQQIVIKYKVLIFLIVHALLMHTVRVLLP